MPAEHVRVPSGLFGSLVLLRGTLYRIVSVIQHSVLAGNILKTRNYLRVIKHRRPQRCGHGGQPLPVPYALRPGCHPLPPVCVLSTLYGHCRSLKFM